MLSPFLSKEQAKEFTDDYAGTTQEDALTPPIAAGV